MIRPNSRDVACSLACLVSGLKKLDCHRTLEGSGTEGDYAAWRTDIEQFSAGARRLDFLPSFLWVQKDSRGSSCSALQAS
jgi:hypothetical protein